MIEWPVSLVEDIARRKCVLFLGAGVSAGSVGEGGVRPPTWRQFLENCCSRIAGEKAHIAELLEHRDYLTACDLLRDRLGDEWNASLINAFSAPKFAPSDLHREVFKLDCRLVLTQNFDKIYDVFAQTETNGSTVVKHYYDHDTPLILRGNHRAVVKVHGTIDEPTRTVFTREDYARVRHDHRSFQSLVDALFLTHTFLFVGCSLTDPDLRLFLEQHAHAHRSAPVHYMTMPIGEVHSDLDRSVRRNMNLRLLRYSPDDEHVELKGSVTDLVEQVENIRAALSISQDW